MRGAEHGRWRFFGIAQTPSTMQATVAEVGNSKVAHQMRVLVVDDEVSLRLAVERKLRKLDIATGSAGTVRHAVERLRAEPYDVVLCDLRMPGGDGEQLVEWISSFSPSTRIIVMSAFVTQKFRETYGAASTIRIVEKPIELDTLVGVLLEFGPRRGFYGNAIEVELFDYVQMIALSGRDKLIEVVTQAGVGHIWFEHGDIVHAEYEDRRGENAFYRLLAEGRGNFKEIFCRPPPMRTVTRSSTHLLMEAAKQADEGILGHAGEEQARDATDDEATPGAVFDDEESSFHDLDLPHLELELESEAAGGGVEPDAYAAAPIAASEQQTHADGKDDAIELSRTSGGEADEESLGLPQESMLAPAFEEEDLAIIDDWGEIEDTAVSEPEPDAPIAALVDTHSAKLSDAGASEPEDLVDDPSASTASGHAVLDDPGTRSGMLDQFWQFDGVDGVAIISSTGKVLAEDMRSNSSLVTLAGFYMRGAARIARTLGHNVFDGVVARSRNGQQMVMVSMGAASAVLSVRADHDPEQVRDAVMGVE